MPKHTPTPAAPAVEEAEAPAVEATKLLVGPDGFVYVRTDTLAALEGFRPYEGDVDAGGFAVQK